MIFQAFGSLRAEMVQCMESNSIGIEFWIFCSNKLMKPSEIIHEKLLASCHTHSTQINSGHWHCPVRRDGEKHSAVGNRGEDRMHRTGLLLRGGGGKGEVLRGPPG